MKLEIRGKNNVTEIIYDDVRKMMILWIFLSFFVFYIRLQNNL